MISKTQRRREKRIRAAAKRWRSHFVHAEISEHVARTARVPFDRASLALVGSSLDDLSVTVRKPSADTHDFAPPVQHITPRPVHGARSDVEAAATAGFAFDS